MSRKTSPVADKDIGRTTHINFLRDEARASSYLLAYGDTATNTLKVLINAGKAYFVRDKVEFAGGYSPVMTEPTASSRIDVISMTSTAQIVVTAGVEADTPTAPAYPAGNIPICEVYHKAGEVKITDEDEGEGEGYINKDIRKFIVNVDLELKLIASDDLRYSSDSEVSNNTAVLTKVKEIKINYAGAVRVKFDLKSVSGAQAEGRIYKNGGGYGTLRTTTGDYVTFSENLEFEKYDLIQLYIRHTVAPPNTAYAQNFRLYFGFSELELGEVIT